MQHLPGKVAFVTGAGSGIGLAIARSLVSAGVKVVISDLRPDHLQTAVDSFVAPVRRDQIHAIQLDVSDRDAMAAAAVETQRVFGKLHILVNNAGVGIEGAFAQASHADWDFGLGVNLGGVVNGLQSFLPIIRAQGEGGHVVNTASLAALVVMPSHLAIYAASKAAVLAITESIRAELAAEGVGVTALCPGPVKSHIHELALNVPKRFSTSPAFAQAARKLARREPSSAWMDAAEVGSLVLEAITNDAPYVITHREWRDAFLARTARILQAMPEKNDPALLASLRRPDTD